MGMAPLNQLKSQKGLFLVSAFNGLSQTVYGQLGPLFKEVSLQIGIDPLAVEALKPDWILCPYLQDYIPKAIFEKYRCLVFHPGPAKRGGPSSLARAILQGERDFEISVIQAAQGWDRGPVWASKPLEIIEGSLAKNYRTQILPEAASLYRQAMIHILEGVPPQRIEEPVYQPKISETELAFDWSESAPRILKKIWAGDNQPGALGLLQNKACRFYGARLGRRTGAPGQVLEEAHGAIQIACGQGSIWVTRIEVVQGRKNRAAQILGEP